MGRIQFNQKIGETQTIPTLKLEIKVDVVHIAAGRK
jgi:hypothetical protein